MIITIELVSLVDFVLVSLSLVWAWFPWVPDLFTFPININILHSLKYHGNMEARTNVYIEFKSLKMVNSFLSGKNKVNLRTEYLWNPPRSDCEATKVTHTPYTSFAEKDSNPQISLDPFLNTLSHIEWMYTIMQVFLETNQQMNNKDQKRLSKVFELHW